MAKWQIKEITETIPSSSRIVHDGPLIITADIEDDVVITVRNGGIAVRPGTDGRIPQIGNKVTLVSQGLYAPNVSGPNAMPQNTTEQIAAYRSSLTAYFEKHKKIPDVPVSGIIIHDGVQARAMLKLTALNDPHGVGIRCLDAGAGLRVKTDRAFIGGNAIDPNINAKMVTMGAVTGGKITATGKIRLDSAIHGTDITSGTVITIRQAEKAQLSAPLVSFVSKTHMTTINGAQSQIPAAVFNDEPDANLPTELEPKPLG